MATLKQKKVKKQAAEQAPPPTNAIIPPHFIRDVVEENSKVKMKPTERDTELLAELARSDAWAVLKRLITKKRDKLESATRQTLREKPDNLAEIGVRYLISDQVSGAFNEVINIVEMSEKFMRELELTKQEQGHV